MTEPSGTTVEPLSRRVAVIDDRGKHTTKMIAANESTVEREAPLPGTTVERTNIPAVDDWIVRLKREGFAPTLTRENGRLIVTCRKQKRGLPGPIPRGCTVLMR